MNPEPEKSLLLPILLSVLGATVVGGGAYYMGVNQSQNQPTVIVTATPVPTSTPIASSTPSPTPSPTATPAATIDSTANWKTYTDTKYGFSFKYPPTWAVKNNTAKNDPVMELALVDTAKKYTSEGSDLFPIVFGVAKDDVNSSIDTYLTGGREPLKSELQSETAIIAGKTAYVLKGSGTGTGGYSNERIIFNGGYIYSFGTNAHLAGHSNINDPIGTPETQAINKVFEDILSTFKFTK